MRTVGLLLTAVALHIFIGMVNDVVDLPIDRNHPGRRKSPLVRGVVKPWHALTLALMQLPCILALQYWQGAGSAVYATLALAIVSMTIYNVWGKRTSIPLATDLVQGIGFASIVLYGAISIGPPSRLTWIAFCWMVVWMLQANVIGGVRDLAFDLAYGARTTPILLGARPSGSGIRLPRAVLYYALANEVALLALVLLPLTYNDFNYSVSTRIIIAIALIALGITATSLLAKFLLLARRDAKPFARFVFVPIGITLGSFVVLLIPNPNRWPMILLMLSYFVPLRRFIRPHSKRRPCGRQKGPPTPADFSGRQAEATRASNDIKPARRRTSWSLRPRLRQGEALSVPQSPAGIPASIQPITRSRSATDGCTIAP
jgi:4-hydroxybenzoate polyprenyltransferase